MDQLVKDFMDTAKERLFKHRFYGAWSVAFCLINWRALYVLIFPSGDILFLDRLDWIDSHFYDSWKDILWKIAVLPFATACFATALFPAFLKWLERIGQKDLVEQHRLEMTALKSLYSTLENAARISNARANNLETDLNASQKEIDRLKEQAIYKMKSLVESKLKLKDMVIALRKGRSVLDFEDKDKAELLTIGVISRYDDFKAVFTSEGEEVALRLGQ